MAPMPEVDNGLLAVAFSMTISSAGIRQTVERDVGEFCKIVSGLVIDIDPDSNVVRAFRCLAYNLKVPTLRPVSRRHLVAGSRTDEMIVLIHPAQN